VEKMVLDRENQRRAIKFSTPLKDRFKEDSDQIFPFDLVVAKIEERYTFGKIILKDVVTYSIIEAEVIEIDAEMGCPIVRFNDNIIKVKKKKKNSRIKYIFFH
jgi:hypothetical protein